MLTAAPRRARIDIEYEAEVRELNSKMKVCIGGLLKKRFYLTYAQKLWSQPQVDSRQYSMAQAGMGEAAATF